MKIARFASEAIENIRFFTVEKMKNILSPLFFIAPLVANITCILLPYSLIFGQGMNVFVYKKRRE
jgi:hypothetical protein